MMRVRHRGLKILLVICAGMLPGVGVDCDWDDGELEIDFDGIRFYDDDYYYDDYYYEDTWFYDPYYPCCY